MLEDLVFPNRHAFQTRPSSFGWRTIRSGTSQPTHLHQCHRYPGRNVKDAVRRSYVHGNATDGGPSRVSKIIVYTNTLIKNEKSRDELCCAKTGEDVASRSSPAIPYQQCTCHVKMHVGHVTKNLFQSRGRPQCSNSLHQESWSTGCLHPGAAHLCSMV